MRYIEQKLKEYNEKKLKLEIIEMRIDAYQYALDHPEIRMNELPNTNPFAIKDGYSSGISIVESNVLSEERMRELLKETIKQEKSSAFHIKYEVAPMEKALEALSPNEVYIIECKIFSNLKLSWTDVEQNYNDKFKKDKNYKYAPERTLRRTYNKSLSKLESLLDFSIMQKATS